MADEFNLALGEKIRARRKEKKMTQAELADGYITRNMICRIEGGEANPSISTLRCIAEKLDVPIGYFFARDKSEEAMFFKNRTVIDIRTALRNGDYDKCEQLCVLRAEFEYDDELVFVRTLALIQSAEKDMDVYHLTSARAKLVSAAEAIVNSAYLTDTLARFAEIQCMLIDSVISGDIPEECLSAEYVSAGSLTPEMYLYLNYLAECDKPSGTPEKYSALLTESEHRDFARAKELMDVSAYADAAPILNRLAHNARYITAYRAASELESCSEKIGDFKGAYAAAKRRLELMRLFNL